jgi:plasmid stability protein
MSINVRLPYELARRVEAVAVERGTSVEAAAVDLLDAALSETEHEPVSNGASRHLAFGAIGASGQSRGATHVDELLAGGSGRD